MTGRTLLTVLITAALLVPCHAARAADAPSWPCYHQGDSVPGGGASSLLVADDRVFVSYFVPSGDVVDAAEQQNRPGRGREAVLISGVAFRGRADRESTG